MPPSKAVVALLTPEIRTPQKEVHHGSLPPSKAVVRPLVVHANIPLRLPLRNAIRQSAIYRRSIAASVPLVPAKATEGAGGWLLLRQCRTIPCATIGAASVLLLGARSTGNSRAVAAHVSILTTDPAVALNRVAQHRCRECDHTSHTWGIAHRSACRRRRFLLKVCSVAPAIEFTPGYPYWMTRWWVVRRPLLWSELLLLLLLLLRMPLLVWLLLLPRA